MENCTANVQVELKSCFSIMQVVPLTSEVVSFGGTYATDEVCNDITDPV